jgi:hypothetical protein
VAKFNLLTVLGVDASGVKRGTQEVSKNIAELKREFNSLKKISFAGKTEEEILALNTRMGQLRDEMGDVAAQQKILGTEFGSVLTQGLTAASAAVEVFVGAMALFGASEEQAQKLQQTMVQLIGITQGLGVLEDAISNKLFRNIALRVKMTASIAAETVSKWSNTVATNAQTRAEAARAVVMGKASIVTKIAAAAQWAWNAALAASPMGVVLVAIGALVTAVVLLTKAFRDNNDEIGINAEQYKELQVIQRGYNSELDELNKSLYESQLQYQLLIGTISEYEAQLIQLQLSISDEVIKIQEEYNKSRLELEELYGEEVITNWQNWKKYKLNLQTAFSRQEAELIKSFDNEIQLLEKNKADKLLTIQEDFRIKSGIIKEKQKQDELNTTKEGNAKIIEEELRHAAELGGILDQAGDAFVNEINEDIAKLENRRLTFAFLGADIDYFTERIQGLKQELKEVDNLIKESEETNSAISKMKPLDGFVFMKPKDVQTLANYNDELDTFKGNLLNIWNGMKKVLDMSMLLEIGFNSLANSIVQMADEGKTSFKDLGQSLLATIRAMLIAYFAQAAAGLTAQEVSSKGLIGLAAAAAGLVALEALWAAYVPDNFATGGIVGGTDFSGDKRIARVNSGEMILNSSQQARLFDMANGKYGYNGDVRFEIEGSKLVGVLSNYNRVINKTR